MTDKQIIIDGCDVSECLFYQSNFEEDYDVKIKHFCSNWHNSCESANNSNCYFKQLARKEQEYEELRQYHNKCCEEFEKEKQALLEKYNQVSINFYNGDYCNTEHCSLLKAKEQECEKYKQTLDEFELLITNHISSCEKCPDNKNGYCIGIDECSSRCLKKILDIINKAKGEEDER